MPMSSPSLRRVRFGKKGRNRRCHSPSRSICPGEGGTGLVPLARLREAGGRGRDGAAGRSGAQGSPSSRGGGGSRTGPHPAAVPGARRSVGIFTGEPTGSRRRRAWAASGSPSRCPWRGRDAPVHRGRGVVEGLEPDPGHLPSVGLRVQTGLGEQNRVLLWGGHAPPFPPAQLVAESVMPDLLRVVPVGDRACWRGRFRARAPLFPRSRPLARGRPTTEGAAALGVSSPTKPALR